MSVNAGTLAGNGNIGGNVTIASGATHALAVAATPGTQDTSVIIGTLALTAGNILDLTAAATPDAGVYVLATASVAITGTPTTINYNGITGTVSVDTVSTPKRLLLTVTASSPEIDVNQGGNIANGGSKGFGTVTLGSNNSLIFTINNTGSGNLNLTTPPNYVAVSGANAGDFTVTSQPSTPVAGPSGNTTFTVRFTPLGTLGGSRNAVLTIANNDSDEGTFTINVSGTAQTQYQAWATNNGLTPGVNDGPTDDPEKDGINNLLEWVLGGNPLSSSTGTLPTITLTPTDAIMTFKRSDDSEGNTTQKIQLSTDLVNWSDFITLGAASAGPVAVVENGAAADDITVTIPRSNEVDGKLFSRMSVSMP